MHTFTSYHICFFRARALVQSADLSEHSICFQRRWIWSVVNKRRRKGAKLCTSLDSDHIALVETEGEVDRWTTQELLNWFATVWVVLAHRSFLSECLVSLFKPFFFQTKPHPYPPPLHLIVASATGELRFTSLSSPSMQSDGCLGADANGPALAYYFSLMGSLAHLSSLPPFIGAFIFYSFHFLMYFSATNTAAALSGRNSQETMDEEGIHLVLSPVCACPPCKCGRVCACISTS